MFDFFRLKSTIGRSYNTDFGDVLNTKKALNGLGFYNKPDYGMTKYPDRGMFNGISGYQKSRGLKVDGLMKPDGETAKSISADIGRRDGMNRRPSIAGQMKNILARREDISRQDVVTGNGVSGSSGSFVPVDPPSRSRMPNPITPIVRAKPTAAPKAEAPWWQSSAKVSGEAHASNGRALDGLLKYSVNGGLPNLFASAIKEAGKPAVAEFGNFMAQLDKRAPERTPGFENKVFNKLGNSQKATHFPDLFRNKSPATVNSAHPNIPLMTAKSGDVKPQQNPYQRPPQAQDTSKPRQGSEDVKGKTSEPPFNLYRRNLRQREGGYTNNPNDLGGPTMKGISKKFLDQYNNKHPDKNLPDDPSKLTDKQITGLYREEFYDRPKIEKLANVSKSAPKLAEQVFDSGVLHGTKNAGQWLQLSLDEQLGTDLRVVGKDGRKSYDGNIGPNTRAAVEQAVREGRIKDVNNSIVSRRKAFMENQPTKSQEFNAGWKLRAGSFWMK